MAYDEVGAWSGRSHPPDAVVVGFNGKDHSRAALAWGTEEAAGRRAPLLVLFAANYPGMTASPAQACFTAIREPWRPLRRSRSAESLRPSKQTPDCALLARPR